MFKENRNLIDCWTFSWLNQRIGPQLIRMKLYECSGFLGAREYIIEMENNYGFIFYSSSYKATSHHLLMGYFFEIHMASILDSCILGAKGYFCFDQINKKDFEIMNSLYWSEIDEAYPNKTERRYPNGNGWNFNPHTKDYYAFFRGESHFEKEQCDIIKAININELGHTDVHFVNLKISNKAAFLETKNGERVYEFENPNHILFLAEHSHYSRQKLSVNGCHLIEAYYKR